MVKQIATFILMIAFCLSAVAGRKPANYKKAAQIALQSKDYAKAAPYLYQWSREAKTFEEKQEAKYYLGVALSKTGLAQIGSFALMDVAKNGRGKYQKMALNHLVVLANVIEDKSLLQYSVSKLTPDELTELSKSSFYLSLSDVAEDQGQDQKALAFAKQSYDANPKNEEALYQMASLSLAAHNPSDALTYFSKLYEGYGAKPETDKKRGLLILNMARTYYQMKNWEQAALYYREIPKDHFYYRQSLKELSWALFRGGQLRSALSPLQSLMTPFYSQFADPEPLLLAGIIYIFSCQGDEAIKTVNLFEQNYIGSLGQVDNYLKSQSSPDALYAELVKAEETLANLRQTGDVKSTGVLPFFVLRTIIEQPDLQARYKYLKRLEAEGKKIRQIFNGGLLSYGNKVLATRMVNAKKKLALHVDNHLKEYRAMVVDMMARFDFLKYEALEIRKQNLKTQIRDQANDTVDKDLTRNYYIQNGYRYWPFQGEYWRDEIGSFQYVGINRCQN
jgi:hypothetical protein